LSSCQSKCGISEVDSCIECLGRRAFGPRRSTPAARCRISIERTIVGRVSYGPSFLVLPGIPGSVATAVLCGILGLPYHGVHGLRLTRHGYTSVRRITHGKIAEISVFLSV